MPNNYNKLEISLDQLFDNFLQTTAFITVSFISIYASVIVKLPFLLQLFWMKENEDWNVSLNVVLDYFFPFQLNGGADPSYFCKSGIDQWT